MPPVQPRPQATPPSLHQWVLWSASGGYLIDDFEPLSKQCLKPFDMLYVRDNLVSLEIDLIMIADSQ